MLVLVVAITGVYGIYFGKYEIEKQETKIAEVQEYEVSQFREMLESVRLDTTIQSNKDLFVQAVTPRINHHTYFFAHQAHPMSGLSLGQRDLFPVYYGITVRDLGRQTNVTELANPMKLLAGNFDLSYVIVFLFPLVIIALFYSLYSSEKEEGILPLLSSQTTSSAFIFFVKGIVRFSIVLVLAITLLILAFVIHGISLAEYASEFGTWMAFFFFYFLFWSLLMGTVVALKRSSSLNAMMGLGLWLVFTLITPSLLNLIILTQEPLPNRAEGIHAVRELNDKIWESPKSFVFDTFYAENPHYNDGDTADFDKWYYASFTLLDEAATKIDEGFEEQIAQRNGLLDSWMWVAPPALLHDKLVDISETGRKDHLEFKDELKTYHEELKQIYYAKIYASEEFTIEDLEALENKITR
jgi:ABC-2 type transport system permease protein